MLVLMLVFCLAHRGRFIHRAAAYLTFLLLLILLVSRLFLLKPSGSLPPGFWLTSQPRSGVSAKSVKSV